MCTQCAHHRSQHNSCLFRQPTFSPAATVPTKFFSTLCRASPWRFVQLKPRRLISAPSFGSTPQKHHTSCTLSFVWYRARYSRTVVETLHRAATDAREGNLCLSPSHRSTQLHRTPQIPAQTVALLPDKTFTHSLPTPARHDTPPRSRQCTTDQSRTSSLTSAIRHPPLVLISFCRQIHVPTPLLAPSSPAVFQNCHRGPRCPPNTVQHPSRACSPTRHSLHQPCLHPDSPPA